MKHRMQIGKTALSFLLTLAMVFGMFPAISTPALADDLEPQNDEAYNLWIGGAQVTSVNMFGDGWSYAPDTNTLTLNGFSSNVVGQYGPSVIYNSTASDLTVELIGENTLDASAATGQAHGFFSTRGYKTIFTGNGTLNAKGSTSGAGIYTSDTSGVFEITSGTIVAEGSIGIRNLNARSLHINGGEVTAIGSSFALFNETTNSIPGEGWDNVAGEGNSTPIPINNTLGYNITSFKKVHFKAPHTHDFTYAVDGATITATCGGTGCELTSPPALTIAAPANTLLSDTNTAPTATLTGTEDFNAATGTSIADSDIAYYAATLSDEVYTKTSNTALGSVPTTAGDYVAEITLAGVKTADSDSDSVTASVGYTLDQAYNLWIGGAQVTSAAPSGDGWAYDAETNTLTLNGFSSTAVYSVDGTGNAVIRHRGDRDLTISFTGKNTLDASGDTQFGSSGMWSDSRQLILCEGEGGGTLICKGSSNYGSGINVIGSAQTTVNSGTVTVSGPSGFAGRTNINGGEVTAITTGTGGAINGLYTNSIPGEGWDNADGTGDSTPIEIHDESNLGNTWSYKRMHFANPYVALTDSTPVTIKKGEDAIGDTAPVVDDVLTASCTATDLAFEWLVGGESQGAAAASNTSYTVKAADAGKTIVAKAYQTKNASGQDYAENERPSKESAATSAVVKKTPEGLTEDAAKTNSGISYVAETVTPSDGIEVSSSNTEYSPVTSLTAILDGGDAPTIYVRRAETEDTAAGEWVAVALTARPNAPENLTATSATTGSTTDGAIIGTASSMEYKLKDGEGDWTAATNDKTTGLAAGTYLVRTKATAENPASKTAEVTVESKQIVLTDGQKPTAKTGLVYDGSKQALLNAPAEALPEGAVEMQYALGKDATNPPEDGWSTSIPTATEAGEYTVWYKAVGDANHLDSEPGKVTSTIKKNEPAPEPEPVPAGAIVPVARGHVQNVGDVVGKASGKGVKVGTEGQSLRLEKFALDLPKDTEGGIEYRGHIQNKGWDEWVAGGKACGTSGQALRLEAVQVRLTGKLAKTHDVWYRVHAQNFGTLGWARGEQAAGTAGQALRIESLEAQVLPKGETPAGYVEGEASYVGAATADVHVQDAGWTGARSALEFGTTGQSRRLEAVRLSVPGLPVGGGVSYEVHAQDRGWMLPAAADGALAGTEGQSKRLEAVRISLTGEAAGEGGYSVWYRVHSQDYGWLGWAHDGAEAGTSGLSKRAEAIDVQVLPQGQVPRGYDASKVACVNG